MKKILISLFCLCLFQTICFSAEYKTRYNPFTGKLDWVLNANSEDASNGDFLRWNSTTAEWEPMAGSGIIDGSGTSNYVTKWSDSDTLTDSIIYDDGTNIGIGTTSTDSLLTVNGTASFAGAVSGISLSEIEDLTASKTFTMAANNLTFNFTTPSDGITLNAIGAFSDHILHIHQSTGNPGKSQLAHFEADDNDVLPFNIVHTGTPTYGYFQVGSSDYDGGTIFNVGPAGNVGIGTTTVGEKLTVSGNIAVSGTVDGKDVSAIVEMTYPGAGIALSTGSAWDTSIANNSANWNTAYGWGDHSSQNYLDKDTDPYVASETDPQVGTIATNYVSKWDGSDLDDSIIYDDGTNVGIGTTTMSQKLTVSGSIAVSGNVDGKDVSALPDGSGTQNYAPKWSDSDTLTDSIIYDNGTNVGIGTTTTGYKLDVNGSGHFGGTGNCGIGTTTRTSLLTIYGAADEGQQVLELDQNDTDEPFTKYSGTSAADQTKSISTVNGDGSVEGPKNYSSSAGWQYEGMVRIDVNGTDYWVPYYSADVD